MDLPGSVIITFVHPPVGGEVRPPACTQLQGFSPPMQVRIEAIEYRKLILRREVHRAREL
jgi:hypothetical protein